MFTGLGHVQRKAGRDICGDATVIPLNSSNMACPIESRHGHEGLQGSLPIRILLCEVLGDSGKIIRQRDRVLKYIVVDALQGVAVPAVGNQ